MISVVTLLLKEKNNAIHATLVAFQQKKIVGIYRKEALMPVSDYKPPGLIGLVFPPQLYGNVSAFADDNKLFLPQWHAGALICDEVFIPKLAAARKKSGAQLLILSGNDAAFTSNLIAQETLRMTQLRAVENRIWIIRAGKTGISAIINPQGDIISSLSHRQRGLLMYP